MPHPNLDHQPGETNADSTASLPQRVVLYRRTKHHRGLTPSPFLPADIRADLEPLFDTLTALRVITNAPEFSDDTREFLIDQIEIALSGATNEGDPPTALTLPALQLQFVHAQRLLGPQWGQRLVQAARRDISRPTCSSWSDLMLYCRYAAEPLGRAVLERCGIANPEIDRATDSLTAALLVLHLMRRAGEDWRLHGRCFIPTEWIAEEGGSPEQLVERSLSPALRRVCSRVLERVSALLEQAAPLPALLAQQPSLRAESVRLLAHAHFQVQQLQTQDMLTKRLRTSFWMRLKAHLSGWFSGRFSRKI